MTKLDRLARSVPDARDIADGLTQRGLRLQLGGSVYHPDDYVIRSRTREGMRGKQPKLSPKQEAHLVALHRDGRHTSAGMAEMFNVARSTVYRAIERAGVTT